MSSLVAKHQLEGVLRLLPVVVLQLKVIWLIFWARQT